MFLSFPPRADSAALQSPVRAPLSARHRGGSALPRAMHANSNTAALPPAAVPAATSVHRPRALSAVVGLRSGAASGAAPASAVPTPPAAATSSAGYPPSASSSSSSAASGTHSARGSAFDSVSAFVASLPSALRPDTKRAAHAARRAQSAVGATRASGAEADYRAVDSSVNIPPASLATAPQWAQPRAPSAGAAYRTAVLSSIPAPRAGSGGGSGTEAEGVPSGRGSGSSAVRWSTAE